MSKFLLAAWQDLNTATIGNPAYWKIALQNKVFYEHMQPIIQRYAHGDILDYGAGRLAWREELRSRGKTYVSLDISAEHAELDLVHPAGAPYPLPDASYDTIFCCSVLEHSPDPPLLLRDMYRLLRQDGICILSVPFIYYLHGAPHDYFRFTRYGVEHLADSAGFVLEAMHCFGSSGLFHVMNMISVGLSSLCWKLDIKQGPTAATALLIRAYNVLAGKNARTQPANEAWAAGYTAVMRKN
jgi:SAM-dependent methyltransferase